jgi:hypothetical protein
MILYRNEIQALYKASSKDELRPSLFNTAVVSDGLMWATDGYIIVGIKDQRLKGIEQVIDIKPLYLLKQTNIPIDANPEPYYTPHPHVKHKDAPDIKSILREGYNPEQCYVYRGSHAAFSPDIFKRVCEIAKYLGFDQMGFYQSKKTELLVTVSGKYLIGVMPMAASTGNWDKVDTYMEGL